MHPHRCYSINVCTCIPFTIINSLLNISSASVVIIADSEGTPKEQTKKHGPHKHNPVYRIQRILTICNLPGHELQHLVQQHDRYRELHHHNPLFAGQWRHLEHGLGGRDRERERRARRRSVSVSVSSILLRIPNHTTIRLTYRQDLHVEDDKVQGEGQSHRTDQPHVAPWGHGDQGLILRQTIEKRERRSD